MKKLLNVILGEMEFERFMSRCYRVSIKRFGVYTEVITCQEVDHVIAYFQCVSQMKYNKHIQKQASAIFRKNVARNAYTWKQEDEKEKQAIKELQEKYKK